MSEEKRPRCRAKQQGGAWELEFDKAPVGMGLSALEYHLRATPIRDPKEGRDAPDVKLPPNLCWQVFGKSLPDITEALGSHYEISLVREPFSQRAEAEAEAKKRAEESSRAAQAERVRRAMEDWLRNPSPPDPREQAKRDAEVDPREQAKRNAEAERARRAAEEWFRVSGTYSGYAGSYRSPFEDFFKQAQDQYKQAPPPRQRQEAGDPYRALLEGLPPDLLKKVYRTIAEAMHPDKGGSTEKMQRVNAAWDRIKKLVKL